MVQLALLPVHALDLLVDGLPEVCLRFATPIRHMSV
jgi:hypothetical protein